jgi:hypothetical protein
VHDGMILQHRDHGNGRLTTLITSTEGGGARATRQYFARSRTEVIACSPPTEVGRVSNFPAVGPV